MLSLGFRKDVSHVARFLGCGDLVLQLSRRKSPKIFHVESVDAIAVCFLSAPQVNGVMDPAAAPTLGGAVSNQLSIIFAGECHQFQVREDHRLDNLPRLMGVERRLERSPGQNRVNFREAVGAGMAPVFARGQLFKRLQGRSIVGMKGDSRGDQNRRIKIPIH